MKYFERIFLGMAMLLPIPAIKKFLYRMCGAHISKSVYVAPTVVINCTDMKNVKIGDNCSLGMGVWIRCKSIEMHQDVKVSGGACIYGKETVSIGKGSFIGHNVIIDCWESVVMEDHVQISPGAKILTHDSSEIYISGEAIFSSPTTMRENSFIGAGAVLLAGVEIGRCSKVGAGAIVTKDVLACTTVVGNPARSHETILR